MVLMQLNGNFKQSSQCHSEFILNSLKATPQLAGYSEKVFLVNQYDEILFYEVLNYSSEASLDLWTCS